MGKKLSVYLHINYQCRLSAIVLSSVYASCTVQDSRLPATDKGGRGPDNRCLSSSSIDLSQAALGE